MDSLQHVAVKGGRKVKSDVPRTELQTFCDIKIAAGVKYLGLHISTVNAETVKLVTAQVRKYVDYVSHRSHTGNIGLENSIQAAYAKSLCLFMLPPLVAADLMNLDEINRLCASIAKKIDGVASHVDHKVLKI